LRENVHGLTSCYSGGGGGTYESLVHVAAEEDMHMA
jgi:hypothetical protein